MKPLIIINFKAYQETIGKKGFKLAQICQEVSQRLKAKVIICPQEPDLTFFAKKFKLPVFAQHLDPFEPGQKTGFIIPAEAKAEGIKGTLINHSEHPLKFKDIKTIVQLCKKYHLISVICVPDLNILNKVKTLKPNYIAYEPPSLIGGKISVTQAKPELIKKAANATKIKLLVGAGVHSHQDVKTALKLGVMGILVASDIVKAKNPKKELIDLIKAQ